MEPSPVIDTISSVAVLGMVVAVVIVAVNLPWYATVGAIAYVGVTEALKAIIRRYTG